MFYKEYNMNDVIYVCLFVLPVHLTEILYAEKCLKVLNLLDGKKN